MAYTTVHYEVADRVAWLVINNPPANALNQATLTDLGAALDEAAKDDQVKAVVITGEGRFFVAGADIKQFTQLGEAEAQALSETGQALFARIEAFRKPVIAAINGACLGGGLELAMACHIRFAAAEAKLGLPELNLGIIPGYGGTQRLPRLVGPGKATQLMLTSDMIGGEEAQRIGLVEAVYPVEVLLDEVKKLAAAITAKGQLAVAYTLEAIQASFSEDHDAGYRTEARVFGQVFGTEDAKEGISAFIEKRKPEFSDR
ncbi:enoyl-CoA hydratase [Brevibacillus fluminis]|uniref:Enoyl-CoA hydratase n=1 Tax=Brevibacillus fluminis TaxID=511487 RepID=A0A3M8DQL8_9BACL|nr:enoyl-CoA hydratase [Brevibacillus fluminis]RNB90372.1 enoyl-CoA hydratase [Brevibacillus fluminis]